MSEQKTWLSFFLFAYFYAGWFGCIYFAKSWFPWLSLLIPTVLVTLLWLNRALRPLGFFSAIILATAGMFFDAALGEWGYILLPNRAGYLAPVWLMAMWLLFTFSMLHLSSKWKIPLWLQLPLGFIMGPLTYKSGEYFAVLEFSHPHTVWIFAIFWAIFFPLLTTIAKKVI